MLEKIKNGAPKAMEEFKTFYEENYAAFRDQYALEPEKMPEELTIGIFLSFFEENAIEFDTPDYSPEHIKDEIANTMISYEEVIEHYS